MPAKMLQAPPSHPQTTHSSISNTKTHTNTRITSPIQANHAKKFITSTLNEQEKETDKSLEILAKKKKISSIFILAEYVINMKIMLRVQAVHHDSKAIIEGLRFYRKYFEESTLKVEKIANDHDMKLILKSSIASIYSKSM